MTRATVFESVQIGVESTPGTAVPANKLLQATSVEPSISAEVGLVRPVGAKFPVASVHNRDWVAASIGGQPAYNDLTYLLASLLSYAAPVQQGTTTAYAWTLTPGQGAPDTVKTYTVEVGSSARAGRFTYGLVTGLTLTFGRRGVEMSGDMIGTAYQDGITMTASPTAIAVVPIMPPQVTVYLDTTASGIGTTKLTRVLSAEWSVGDRHAPVWVLDASQSGYVTHVETPPAATLKLTLEADATGMGLLAAMRAGSLRYVRIEAVGPTIQTPYNYQLRIDMAGVVSEVGELGDQDGVYAIEWTLHAVHDAVWGKALSVELINTLSAL